MNKKNRLLFKLFFYPLACCLTITFFHACNEKRNDHTEHQDEIKERYTCPMPQDSVFSDKPGTCPKCGMDLVKVEPNNNQHEKGHSEPGREQKPGQNPGEIILDALLRPTNEFVIATLPLVAAIQSEEPVEIDALGYTAYNTSRVGNIGARISGRIEKLYVKYRYQKITSGQRIMDIYSPELMTAQQNLLFLLKTDGSNNGMIEAAKRKLLLLGFPEQQLQQVIESGKPSQTVAVYSNYSGHIHEAGNMEAVPATANTAEGNMNETTQITQELNLKEGMYLQKGQPVFSVYDPNHLWVLLNIYPQDQFYVRTGDKARIIPETSPGTEFTARINYIEPFFRKGSKTIAARVQFDNKKSRLPVGSQVKATIYSGMHKGLWLPKEAVLSLGLDKVVFLRIKEGFKVHKIEVGHEHKKLLQVIAGLSEKDSVAANAQFLVDSESFIKLKDE